MNPQAPAHESPARLALACSALARAGQALSSPAQPAQARTTLRNVANQLLADRTLSSIIATDEVARRCRQAADNPDDSQVVATCRQVATSLARQASALAAQIQQQATATPSARPEAQPVPLQPAAAPEPEPAPIPAELTPTLTPAPIPGIVPAPTPPPRPSLTPDQRSRWTIVQTNEEEAAVAEALGRDRRFVFLPTQTFIDLETNRMWTDCPSSPMSHYAALAFSKDNRTGGYDDWRLPDPEELRQLLADSGHQALRAQGILPASGSIRLWTAPVRSRFFGLLKQALAAHSATGELSPQSLGQRSIQTLLVRGG